MDSERSRHDVYLAYMLRLWRAGSHGGLPVWRASLENPHTGERVAFSDVTALFAFLAEQTGALAEARNGRAATELGDTEPGSDDSLEASK